MAGFPQAIMKGLGAAFGASARTAKTAPTLAAAGGVFGAHWLSGIGAEGVRSGANSMGLSGGPIDMEAARVKYLQDRSQLHRRKQDEIELALLRQDVANNAAALASSSPHLYNQLMAGRRLPQGATVLGGRPRTDLLEELAYKMAQGQTMSASPNMPSQYVDFNDVFSSIS